MQPIIDIHIHIQPLHMLKAAPLEILKRGRKNFVRDRAFPRSGKTSTHSLLYRFEKRPSVKFYTKTQRGYFHVEFRPKTRRQEFREMA